LYTLNERKIGTEKNIFIILDESETENKNGIIRRSLAKDEDMREENREGRTNLNTFLYQERR